MTALDVINGDRRWSIETADALAWLKGLPDACVNCCVTSPPYYSLRDYGHDAQLGMEPNVGDYVAKLATIFEEVRRVLTPCGTAWLNLGDSYSSSGKTGGRSGNKNYHSAGGGIQRNHVRNDSKPKDLLGVPWLAAFTIRNFGWYLRDAIIWAKPNGMPGSQEDRPTSSYEMIFLLSKSARYYSDFDSIKTPPRESSIIRTAQNVQAQAGSHRANGQGKTNGPMKAVGVRPDKQRGHSRRHAGFNERWDAMERSEQQLKPVMIRNVWFVPPEQEKKSHFAVMPPEVARRCILAGCPAGGIVMDPFAGSGTTLRVAVDLGCRGIGCDLNPQYVETIARPRMESTTPGMFA